MDRQVIAQAILDTLRNFDFPDLEKASAEFTEETILFGREGLLDSIALVSFILDVEESIRAKTGVPITLADERAMSQSRSPFRRVSSLADYASQLISEQLSVK
ncbi:MAG: hypothetical protein JNM65_18980 [Verrucomicrobiaceae bacterium]|nr:hypothetical protein [Verrucomicrobiaceae bacterium]